jgi:hypothetical protein
VKKLLRERSGSPARESSLICKSRRQALVGRIIGQALVAKHLDRPRRLSNRLFPKASDHKRGHMSSHKNPGRFAGLLYLLASIPGAFALIYVPSKLIVHGDATATANNIGPPRRFFASASQSN